MTSTNRTFWQKLVASIRARDSLLCVGLDPVPEAISASGIVGAGDLIAVEGAGGRRFTQLADFGRAVVEATAPYVCAFKPNIAFYEAFGQPGLDALRETLACIPEDIPVILDAKRNDISSTAEAYARAVFEAWDADAVTVNPYLGADGVLPFLAYKDRGVFVLCKTSNPSAGEIQDWRQSGTPLYEHVADLAGRWATAAAGPSRRSSTSASYPTDDLVAPSGGEIGLVMGATYPQDMARIRARWPKTWFLVPGVGAQGGELEAVLRAGLDDEGMGVIINASRSVIYAPDPAAAARELRDDIAEQVAAIRASASLPKVTGGRGSAPLRKERVGDRVVPNARPSTSDMTLRLCRGLHDAGCVRFGDFTLHSGAWSPVYVDLRMLVSQPALLADVAQVYAETMEGLVYDRIAGIPYAALPIATAVSLRLGQPMIYPRGEVKAHGTRRAVEGAYQPGERALVLDDLISSGGSKLEAIAALEAQGLVVEDVVVLIDREQGGREDLASHGYRLHAALTLRELAQTLADDGRLSAEELARVMDYLGGGSR
jgi:uridine monophosphate synthetase